MTRFLKGTDRPLAEAYQLALLDLGLLGGQIDHLLLAGDLGVGFGFLDLLGTQVGLDHTGGLGVSGGLVGLGFQFVGCGLCSGFK